MMSAAIVTGFLTALSGILVAGVTYWFTKQREREAEWRKEKLEHYKEFVASLSGNLLSGATSEGQRVFARARNNIMLVAPQTVIEALHAFEQVIRMTNANKDIERHDEFLSRLFYEIRRDLHISPSDETSTFRVSLKVPGVELQQGAQADCLPASSPGSR